MRKSILKKVDKYIFLFTFIIWGIMNISGIQNIYFSDGKFITVAVIKILHLLFMYFLFHKIYDLYKNRKTQNGKYEIIIAGIYFLVLILLLVFMWPGLWSWDDIGVLSNASSYKLSPWQHFFSGLFQILCLQTIPFAAGVIIIQSLIAALIVGYTVSNISSLYGNNKKQILCLQIILMIIMLFPPIIAYILSGFRMGMYSYFELLVIAMLLILYKKNKRISLAQMLTITFFTIIISSWRTEALYYPFVVFILYLILGKKVVYKKVALIAMVLMVIFNFSIGKLNNHLIGTNNYSVTATMEPVTSIVKIADESDKEEIDVINKVIDVKYVLDNPNKTGENYYWTNGVVKKYTEEEYSEYLKAYMKLALKYPDVVVQSMWNIFYKTANGFGNNSKQTARNMFNGSGTALKLFDENNGAGKRWKDVDSKFKDPINLELRNSFITFIAGVDSNNKLTLIHNIFWNLFIPFTLILICLIYKLIKKDWFMVFLILAIIARIPLIFVTAPAPYFMYYLSTYICSYFLSAIVIFEFISNLFAKKTVDIEI